MNYWRMAFRIGDRGYEMWQDCYNRGIAAIGYYTDDGKPVVKDCSIRHRFMISNEKSSTFYVSF